MIAKIVLIISLIMRSLASIALGFHIYNWDANQVTIVSLLPKLITESKYLGEVLKTVNEVIIYLNSYPKYILGLCLTIILSSIIFSIACLHMLYRGGLMKINLDQFSNRSYDFEANIKLDDKSK